TTSALQSAPGSMYTRSVCPGYGYSCSPPTGSSTTTPSSLIAVTYSNCRSPQMQFSSLIVALSAFSSNEANASPSPPLPHHSGSLTVNRESSTYHFPYHGASGSSPAVVSVP